MRLMSDGSFVYIYMCIAVTQGELCARVTVCMTFWRLQMLHRDNTHGQVLCCGATLLHCAALRYAVLCCAVLCCAMLCHAVM